MAKPQLLDLFCGAGGAAMGYYRAGFEVVGVDIEPQPRYPFEFHQADALTYPLDGFDVIHASPLCEGFSNLNAQWQHEYPNYIPVMRDRLSASDKPYIIENVPGAPLLNPLRLCGSMFGLKVIRHRLFESNMLLLAPGSCHHSDYLIFGDSTSHSETAYRNALGVHWMRARTDARKAIPPAYTEWIGRQLLAALVHTARSA